MSVRESKTYVGIAASAGGLEALSLLVQNLPENIGAVYVVAQHMSPTHKSHLTSLIARETSLQVVELATEHGTEPMPDTIYITPPNSDVSLQDGKLILSEPSGHPATPKPSGDKLFKSIAQECRESAVGIVLSGTGTDGSYGVQAIRELGGITIAQDTASAKYDGMPGAAIETGCVDLTLTPEQIGKHLEKILAHPRDFDGLRHINEMPTRLSELLQILMARTRIDFRDYKDNTVNRRINRRMVALGIENYEAYVDHCRTSVEEVDALHRDLLISVTRFFRDPKQFRQLEAEIWNILRVKRNAQIRVWIAGCATGEEVYSIAILFAEALGGLKELAKSRIQIFATDIDENALEIARRGRYPIAAANDIPQDYLEKYFSVSDGNIIVATELRSVTLFSKHNIFQDPPFINVDVVSLRNVLIYFNALLQERVLNRVHYSLAPDGILFLGTSESVGALTVQFEARADSDKIFTKRGFSANSSFTKLESGGNSLQPMLDPPGRHGETKQEADVTASETFDALARGVVENGFLATRGGEIIKVYGEISPFLELNEASSLSLSVRLLARGMRDEAGSMISVAIKSKERRFGRWHSIAGSGFNQARLVCFPVLSTRGEDVALIGVDTRVETEVNQDIETLSDKERTQYILHIETEMQSTREALQQMVEELQTSNEELQSVNEELQSTNEELQATNEELETSNEELQSTNEELITVNEEMQVNSAELLTVTTELGAVLTTTPFPVLVVDHALFIRRASSRATQFFGISEIAENGLHMSQANLPHGFPNITEIASEVFKLQRERTIEVELDSRLMNVVFSPFNDGHGHMLGLTVSVLETDLSATNKMTEIMEQMGDLGHWRANAERGTIRVSSEINRALDLPTGNDEFGFGRVLAHFHPEDRDMVRRRAQQGFAHRRPFRFEARMRQRAGRTRYVQVAGSPVFDGHGEPVTLVGAFRDITNELNTHMLLENFERVQSELNVGMFSLDIENDATFLTSDIFGLLGLSPEGFDGTLNSAFEHFSKPDKEHLTKLFRTAANTGEPFEYIGQIEHSSEGQVSARVIGLCRKRIDGSVSHIYGSVQTLPRGNATQG